MWASKYDHLSHTPKRYIYELESFYFLKLTRSDFFIIFMFNLKLQVRLQVIVESETYLDFKLNY